MSKLSFLAVLPVFSLKWASFRPFLPKLAKIDRFLDHFCEHEYVPANSKGPGWEFLAEVSTGPPKMSLFRDFRKSGDKIGTYTACSGQKVLGEQFDPLALAVGPDFVSTLPENHENRHFSVPRHLEPEVPSRALWQHKWPFWHPSKRVP